jgi:hypothetical protein
VKDKLQIAVEQIVAHLHENGIPEHLAEAIKVLDKRLAEKHREQQIEDELIAGTVGYWRQHMRDKKGQPIPVDEKLIRETVDWALQENQDKETTVKEVISRAACLRDDPSNLNRPDIRRQIEGFAAICGYEFVHFGPDDNGEDQETTH